MQEGRMATHRIDPGLSQMLAFTVIRICMLAVLAFVGILVYYIVINGIGHLSIEFLTSPPRQRMTAGGIFPAIVGTVMLIGLSMALIHISEPTRLGMISYAVFCLKK